MFDRHLRIVQVNTLDLGGGAEKVATSLHHIYRRLGHDAQLVVGQKQGNISGVISIDNSDRWKGMNLLKIAQEKLLGRQYIDYPGSHRIPELINEPFDIVHLHNLHGGYFDLEALSHLAKIAPIILMLHDEWLLTGHCACTFNCERWRIGCGECHDLSISPEISYDATRFNWQRKKRILTSFPIVITAPSKWLLDEVEQSYLNQHPRRLIYNGIDHQIFYPGSKKEARQKLGLPEEGKIVLFSANAGLLNWKSGTLPMEVVKLLLDGSKGAIRPTIISLGGKSPRPPGVGREARRLARRVLRRPKEEDVLRKVGLYDKIIQCSKVKDEQTMADYYRAADVLAYTTIADNCPLSVLEALSCGLPVVASEVGGVPELVRDGKTGLIVPLGDAAGLVTGIQRIIEDEQFQKALSTSAAMDAKERFDIQRQAKEYLELYTEIIDEWQGVRDRS